MNSLEKKLREYFEWFHRHPELSYEEYGTTKRIREILEEAGVEILPYDLETGLVAIIRGEKEGAAQAEQQRGAEKGQQKFNGQRHTTTSSPFYAAGGGRVPALPFRIVCIHPLHRPLSHGFRRASSPNGRAFVQNPNLLIYSFKSGFREDIV